MESEDPGTCRRRGCDASDSYTCSYVDRRARACATGWCAQHCLDVGGRHFCARHASTVIAVGDEALQLGHLPELENRVPSLVYWLGRDLDGDVPTILAAVMDAGAGEQMIIEPVALVAGGGRVAERRWERNWKVISHTGITERITIQVMENAPTEVVLRVGQVLVAKEVPPWIAERSATGAHDEAAARQTFYTRLHHAMTAALVPRR